MRDGKLVEITRTIRFLDTFRVMPSQKYMSLLTGFRKNVFPYEYLDTFGEFNEPLPPNEAFYSSLDQGGITDEDYGYVVPTMKQFNLNTLGDVRKYVLFVC